MFPSPTTGGWSQPWQVCDVSLGIEQCELDQAPGPGFCADHSTLPSGLKR